MKKILLFAVFIFPVISFAQNVGIGTSTPTQKLDVVGNIKFSGALMPSGSAGVANNVLLSQGSGTAPAWGNVPAGQIYNTVYSTDSINLTYDGGVTFYSLPGMSQSVTVPSTGTYDMLVYTDGSMQWNSNTDTDNNSIQTILAVYIDGTLSRTETVNVDNTYNFGRGYRSWSFTASVANISAGVHTFEVKAKVSSTTGALPATVTFCDPNVVGNIRIGDLTILLVRK